MKISIGCPILNAGEDIHTFFCDHLVNDPDVEYVIYENASTDGTRDYIKEWEDRLTTERVKVFYSNKNDGCNVAADWILRNYTTDNMFWFNDDYIVHKEKFYEPYLKYQETNRPAIITFPTSKEILKMQDKPNGFYLYTKEHCTEIQGGFYPSSYRIFYIPRAITNKVKWETRYFYAYGDADYLFKAYNAGFPLMAFATDEKNITRKEIYTLNETQIYNQHYISDTQLFYSIWNKANIIL